MISQAPTSRGPTDAGLTARVLSSEWQVIETAPKNGSAVILWPQMVVAYWDFGSDNWLVMNIPLDAVTQRISDDWIVKPKMWFELMADIKGVEPSHWHPFPTPPTNPKGAA